MTLTTSAIDMWCPILLLLSIVSTSVASSVQHDIADSTYQTTIVNLIEKLEKTFDGEIKKVRDEVVKVKSSLEKVNKIIGDKKGGIRKDITKFIKVFLGCLPPWKKVDDDMCLLADRTDATWREAQATCEEYGGNLVFIENEAEHKKIDRFASTTAAGLVYSTIWIGLHRNSDGELVWAGPQQSTYRGLRPMKDEFESYLAAEDSGHMRFTGYDETKKFPFVCRLY